MREAAFLSLVRGERKDLVSRALRSGLWGLSVPYGVAAGLRNLAFDRSWKATHHAAVPVVAIGNLTLGGTGKTPMVEWVARWYRSRNLRVAILSRGYGGSEGLNDEGRVLEENLPNVPHLQNADRVGLARIAVEELDSQVLVLDDGFQHRRLARDLDIVLVDALEPFGAGHLLPRGLLREPIRSLRRAGVVVLSRADLVDGTRRAAIRDEARRRAGPLLWVEARHAPRDLMREGAPAEPLERLAGTRVAAFCGIGNPEGFRRTLASLGVSPLAFRAFPDHHAYSREDVSDLAEWAKTAGAELVLTTQKDSVKLRVPGLGSVPLYALRIGLDVLGDPSSLDEALARLVPG